MNCHVCSLPTYDRVIDRVKKDDEVKEVAITAHKHSNLIYCD
jgi:hypothetical protein